MNQNKINTLYTTKGVLQRISIFILTATILLTTFSDALVVLAAGNGGFVLNLAWTGGDKAEYLWDASNSETKTVRLQVSYNNQMPERGYAPGELVITVPGIGKAYRGKTMQATDVAADKAGSPVTTKNWSYTYNNKTDTYTFTNNVEVKEATSFTGSFELLWTMRSRETVDDYNQNLQAVLQTVDNKRVMSNEVSYVQNRVKDAYSISQLPTALYSAQGINGTLNIADYYWVGFPVKGNRQEKSLGIKSSYYKVLVPTGAVVTYALNSRTQASLPVTKDGDDYIIQQNAGVDEYTYPSGNEWTYIYVAYPKSLYNDSSTVTSSLELWGQYNDSTTDEELAQAQSMLRLGDYNFNHHEGKLYTLSERAFGPRTRFEFHAGSQGEQESNDCYYDGFLNATDLTSGKGLARFGLGSSIYSASQETPYSMEFCNDFFDVQLNSGSYRQLDMNEYEYNTVEIPSTNTFRNENNVPVQSGVYRIDIYAVTLASPGTKELVKSTTIQNSSQSVTLPANTYRVYIELKDLKENVNFENWMSAVSPIYVTTKFHLNDDSAKPVSDRVKTDSGRVINSAYFKIYNKDGNWINNGYTPDDYENSTNLDIAKRDMDTYGTYFERVRDVLHVHEITSMYYSNVMVENTGKDSYGFNLSATLKTYFKYGGDGALKKFSMSTILPDGVCLPYSQIDITDFLSSLSVSSLSDSGQYISSAELISRTTAVVEKDYRGSGRVYVRLDFDFTGLNITDPNSVSAKFPVFISNEEFARCGSSYNFQNVSMVGDTDYVTRAQYNGADDNGSYDKDPALWSDMNQNSNVAERLSYSRSSFVIEAAIETHLEANKSVSTEYTNGQYFPGTVTDAPRVGYDDSYTYKLKLSTQKNSKATNIVFLDHLETGENAVWNGYFAGVDVSYAQSLGFTPTVYYSSDRSQSADLSSPGWSNTPPDNLADVRSIAVDLGAGELRESGFVYILVNMTAPGLNNNLKNTLTENNYSVAFTSIDTVSSGRTQKSLNSNSCHVMLVEPFGRVILTKADNKGVLLSGVTFDFLDENQNVIKSGLVTDGAGRIVVDQLSYGNYFFRESKVPEGYVLDETPLPVTVSSRTVNISKINQRKPGQITLIKKNSENQLLNVEGAVFSLFKADGTMIQAGLTTNSEGRLDSKMYSVLGNLEWGDYYFQETAAPTGYMLDSTPIRFKIDAAAAEKAGNNILNARNSQNGGANLQFTKYEMLENGKTQTTNPVSGAVYELYFQSGTWKSMGTYITDANGEIYISGLIYGDYYLKEKYAPQGYNLNADEIHFTVGGMHSGQNYQTAVSYDVRKYGHINLYKTGNSKEEVKGSVFGLYNLDGTLIKSGTTSAEGVIDFYDVVWGQYYLQEISAPPGYELNTKQYFVTVERGNVDNTILQNVTNNQVKGKVRLTKMAEANHDLKLAGAVYTLYKSDGSLVGEYTSDANGVIFVEGLSWGAYYFEETKAPDGYGLSSDKIRFSVNAVSSASVQELEAFDPALSAQIMLTKKVKADSIVFAHGDPSFTFKVTGTDINGITHTYYKSVTFTKEYVDSQTPDAYGYIAAGVVFAQLTGGKYTASEEPVIRYSQGEIEDVQSGEISGQDVIFTLDGDSSEGKATFKNEKVVQGGTSHTSMVNNIIRKSKLLTGISASYRGTGTITSSKLDRDLLDVYAIYDDGSQVKLGNDAYTLDPENFEALTPGDYTVTVSYNEKKAYFQVNIDPPIPFTWTINKTTGEATITGYTGSSSVVRFPAQVKEKSDGKTYPVTSLGNSSATILGLTTASSIIIPEGIKKIGANAFLTRTNLTGNLKLPSTLVEIGASAFNGCSFSGDLTIPDGVVTIGAQSFDCSRTVNNIVVDPQQFVDGSLTLPASLKTIGKSAFRDCGFKGDLTIPQGVTSVGAGAFYGRDSTKQIPNPTVMFENGKLTLPTTGLTDIEDNVFRGCGFTGTLTIPQGVTNLGGYAFYGTKFTGDLVIPDSVIKIGASAFNSSVSASGGGFRLFKDGTLKLSNNLTTIGSYAFSKCYFSGDLIIPDSVTTIGGSAFASGSSNDPIGFKGGKLILSKSLTTIGNSAFMGLKCIGPLEIPDSVEVIDSYAFSYLQEITSLKLPNNAKYTTITYSSFYEMEKVAGNVAIPDSVTEIGNDAFGYGYKISSLTLSKNLKSIDKGAFYALRSISEIKLPDGLQKIGKQAFGGTTNAKHKINIPNSVTSMDINVFYNSGITGIENWPSEITAIPDGTFQNCTSLEGVLTIPDSITSIGKNAFFGCSNVTGITLPNNLASIGESAFNGCVSVVGEVTVPKTISTYSNIGLNAFNSFGKDINTIVLLPDFCEGHENDYYKTKRCTFSFYS